jgi:hypothetical protein
LRTFKRGLAGINHQDLGIFEGTVLVSRAFAVMRSKRFWGRMKIATVQACIFTPAVTFFRVFRDALLREVVLLAFFVVWLKVVYMGAAGGV